MRRPPSNRAVFPLEEGRRRGLRIVLRAVGDRVERVNLSFSVPRVAWDTALAWLRLGPGACGDRPRERLVKRQVVRARDRVGGLLDVLLNLGRPHRPVLRVLEIAKAAGHERGVARDVRRGHRGPLQVAVVRHRLSWVRDRILKRPEAPGHRLGRVRRDDAAVRVERLDPPEAVAARCCDVDADPTVFRVVPNNRSYLPHRGYLPPLRNLTLPPTY